MAKDQTTTDAFLGGRLSITQPATGYRAGIDAVLLAAATPARQGFEEHVLDAGAGVGTAGMAVATRISDTKVTLVEIDPGLAALAEHNIAANGLSARVNVTIADIARGGAIINDPRRPPSLEPGRYHHVIANPPYYQTGTGTPPQVAHRAVAHQMLADDLGAWVAFMASAARHGGTLTMIHRADALGSVLNALAGRFGCAQILPLQPRQGTPAHRVIIRAKKDSRAPLVLLPPLILHGADSAFMPDIEAVLRNGASLPFTGDHSDN